MSSRNSRGARVAAALIVLSSLVGATTRAASADDFAADLPPGVKAVWDLARAHHEQTSTRERICVNGLWRWQPAWPQNEAPPGKSWGYFKVPGCWPGITDYLQKDSQTLHAHPAWKDTRMASVTAAWYEREIEIPHTWQGRRIALALEYLNSYANIFVDGKPAGEIRFPGGELDLTRACRAGERHMLSMLVVALPLKGVMLSYSDTASAREVKGTVARRGLCGDVFLVSTPKEARVGDFRIDTSVRKSQFAIDAALVSLSADEAYTLRARITRADGREAATFASPAFRASDLQSGRVAFSWNWKPAELWDLHTPANQFHASLTLVDSKGNVLDTALEQPFGFREFWIDGRDFYLNGSRLFLSSVPLDNAQVGAAWANYAATRESLERLKAFGVNMVYTHNYGCEPGTHLGLGEVLRAADDVGMLVSFSQPHFGQYDWKAPEADRENGYRRHAEFYVRQAQNHPSVVFYSMSHNATGYGEDMNPDLIDGVHEPRETWGANNAKLALRAEGIVHTLDPSRIVYHHSSGNLGSMHTVNFYPNFAPIQELSDWFGHWAKEGAKPFFSCEYGAPFTWDWAMYRGWYKGQREFGSARVPWEACFAEWNAQFLGDRAYKISEMEKANLRWEAKQFRAGNLWHRWDYPVELGSPRFEERHAVIGMYLTDNLRAYRTWGVSATSPWEHGHFWSLRKGVDRSRKNMPVDWENLQRPGFSPDYIAERYERMDLAFGRDDWLPTADGQALLRNNRPLLAYIGGPGEKFTSKDHNVQPGGLVEKSIVVVNNSRETVACECTWTFGKATGRERVSVPTGQVARVPLRLRAPADVRNSKQELEITAAFSTGETQHDSFWIHVVPADVATQKHARFALYDPKGETKRTFQSLGIPFRAVGAATDAYPTDILVIGKDALTIDGPGPQLDRVAGGLKVVVLEQRSAVLEKRLGFRVTEYGLRQVWPRLADHPLLAGLIADNLRDWRGEATLLPPRLEYELRPRYGPTVTWCDIPVTRVWRAGNRGNVASVLIEKPARGDFLPIVDGGFSLQYSPLLVYRDDRGFILFSQLDLTGRTERDPAAESMMSKLLEYAATWQPGPSCNVVYAGSRAGRAHLEAAGIAVTPYDGSKLSDHSLLVVAPGCSEQVGPHAPEIAAWLKHGGHALAIGLDEAEARACLPVTIRTKRAEHIAAYFETFGAASPFAGIGPADVHNKDPRSLPLITEGAEIVGDGVLAFADEGRVVFCQLVPWQLDYEGKPNVKRTYRRASFLVSRLLANMGVHASTPLVERFATPPEPNARATRWREGLYLDQPEEWDEPYRFFRW